MSIIPDKDQNPYISFNLQFWQSKTESQQQAIANAMGVNTQYIDTALSAAEQLQPGINQPESGGTAPPTTNPNLITPDWGLASFEGLMLGSQLQTLLGSDLGESLVSFLGLETPSEDELAYVKEAEGELYGEQQLESLSSEGPAVQQPKEQVPSGLGLPGLANKLSNAIKDGTKILPEEYQQIVDNLSSPDPAKVREALSQLVDLNKLTPEQRTLVESKLDVLGENIAASIAEGGGAAFFIRLGIPELLAVQFSSAIDLPNDTSLSDAEKETLQTVFMEMGTKLSEINLAAAVSVKPPSPEYTELTSQDAAQLTKLMNTLFQSISIPEGVMTEEERSLFISALVEELSGAPLPKGLTSTKEKNVSEALAAIIEKLVKEGKLPGDAASVSTQKMYIIPMLGQKIAAINEAKCLNDLYSPDETAIDGALRNLGDLPPAVDLESLKNLSPEEVAQTYGTQIVLDSYLKVLVKALSFLAQIRCLISSAEGQFTQELGRARQAALADQVSAANKSYTAELEKLQTQFGASLKQIQKAALMRWLMPFITVLTAVIALAITIAITIVTVGVGTGPAVAASVAIINAIVIGLSVATTVLTIVDAVMQACGKKGTMEMLSEEILEAISPEDQPAWAKALINAIIQIVITVVIALLTLGTGLIAAGVKLGMTMFGDVFNALAAPFMRSCLTIFFTCAIQPLLSSGLIFQAIKLAAEALCKGDEAKSTIIAAIAMAVITVILMVAMCLGQWGMGKVAAKYFSSAAKTAAESTKQAAVTTAAVAGAAGGVAGSMSSTFATSFRTACRQFMEFLRFIGKGIEDFFQPLLKMLSRMMTALAKVFSPAAKAASQTTSELAEAANPIMQSLSKAMERLKEVIKSIPPGKALLILDTAKNLLSIGANIVQLTGAIDKARYQKELARITKEIAELEASLSFLESLTQSAVDQSATLKNLSADAEERAQAWATVVNLIASFIEGAMNNLNTLVTEGAAR